MTGPEGRVELDAARQQQAREYARIRRRLSLLDLLLGGLYLLAWLVSGLNVLVRDWALALTSSPVLALLIAAAALTLPYALIGLPLAYYSGYVLPHRYGQSTQNLSGWVSDQIKGAVLGGVLGVIVVEMVYGLIRLAPTLWWLYAGGVMLFFTVVLSTLAPVLIAPLFYRFTPLDDRDLSERLIALAERAGTRVQGVFRFDMSSRTRSANAALMGLGATRRIVLGDTLLDEFTPDEIETVLAHELGHHVHRDIPLLIAIDSVLTLLTFLGAHLALVGAVSRGWLANAADPAGLPLLALVIGAAGLATMPPGNAVSRWRERMADSYAVQATGKPQAFIDAMTRLANQNLADADPEPWVVWLLHSHPPIRERVAAAQRWLETGG
ncbi:MAG: M48 family metallopeptidase [Anaerolineae bacterium]